PQLNFGGRAIFWSGLIPSIQDWELEYFPGDVRQELSETYLTRASKIMNQSVSMGKVSADIVNYLRNTELNNEFVIVETPRALHQPYLNSNGVLTDDFFIEPTGVFNTAELLINQLGLVGNLNRPGEKKEFNVKLNSYVESVDRLNNGTYEVKVVDTITQDRRSFFAPKVVIAAGSIESPKIILRSNVYDRLPEEVQRLVGLGLTDHPTTNPISAKVTNIGPIIINTDDHGKIMLYSRGNREADGSVRYPFNIEMNINGQYWHRRENDPSSPTIDGIDEVTIDIKFSFGNPLEDRNIVSPHGADDYKSKIFFKDHRDVNYLYQSRFPALADWNKSADEVYWTLNNLTYQILSKFSFFGNEARPQGENWYGPFNNFGYGTVHHAIGTLRMPYKPAWTEGFQADSVVDQNLQVINNDGLYVCDMSVMPFSSAANPVRTLGALALRLSKHLVDDL
ncbi:MAG: GMC oxidoreductase, partial [Cyanobacteria bacterium P01_H01_bin.15]